MNIFLDTNILIKDPFFKTFLGDLIMKEVNEEKIKIFIPEIVLKETIYNHNLSIQSTKTEIKKSITQFSKLIDQSVDFNFSNHENIIENFFEKLIDSNKVTIITQSLQNFTDTLYKSINHTPPFFKDKKKEFKDSLIWESIVSDIKMNKRTKNHFISENYADFWNNSKTNLHPLLEKYDIEIDIYKSYNDLFDKTLHLQSSKKKKEFQLWFSKQNINLESVKKALPKYLKKYIVEMLTKEIESIGITDLYPDAEVGFVKLITLNPDGIHFELIETNIRSSYAEIKLKLTSEYLADFHLPNLEERDFSNVERTNILSEFELKLAYNEDNLFTPISITETSSLPINIG